MYARTRQTVETSTLVNSTAQIEINTRGISMLYPPVGQLAVAEAAGLVGHSLVSGGLVGSQAIGVGAHDDDEGEVVEVDEQRRAVAYETLPKNLIAPLPYRIWRGGVSEACSPVNRVRSRRDGITDNSSSERNDWGASARRMGVGCVLTEPRHVQYIGTAV